MSFGGSVAAMITSLRNNKNLRLDRNKYFNNNKRKIQTETGKRNPPAYKHLTKTQILEIREEISAKSKVETLKKITAIIIALMLVVAIMFLFVKYFDITFVT